MKRRILSALQQGIHVALENKGLKLLSILLAILLFAFSRQPISDVRINEVPVEFRGIPPGVEIVGDQGQLVSVRLQGPRDIVRSLNANQISVTANLSNKEPGDRIAQLHPDDVSRPEHVQVLQILPPSIRLHLERTAVKSVKVEAKTLGRVAEGWEIYDMRSVPPRIEIEGPESHIEKAEFVSTETINLTGRKSSFEEVVDVETPTTSLRVKTRERIRLFIDIGERRTTRYFPEVGVEWPDRGPGDKLITRAVALELHGPASILNTLSAREIEVKLLTNNLPGNIISAAPNVVLPDRCLPHVKVKQILPAEIKFKKVKN